MKWHELYPKDTQPSIAEVTDYIGDAGSLLNDLVAYMDAAYKAKPKFSYSNCMIPGWNIKYQKSGQSFGTLYPEDGAIKIMVVISYKLDPIMEATLPQLSENTADLYKSAGDYMKMGKWFMLCVNNETVLDDYKKIMAVKLPPKIA